MWSVRKMRIVHKTWSKASALVIRLKPISTWMLFLKWTRNPLSTWFARIRQHTSQRSYSQRTGNVSRNNLRRQNKAKRKHWEKWTRYLTFSNSRKQTAIYSETIKRQIWSINLTRLSIYSANRSKNSKIRKWCSKSRLSGSLKKNKLNAFKWLRIVLKSQ